ncbi:hypothetical protein E2C01_076320 [Portunus trituberculatus]|uniref:Uncharacterized protein n=1 Tax=Portunus trituberculatus TaxID=210409 RepID=A0A5B7IIM1_PORTR|nr:hypothetical protein [Portunus trituberculatus]
MLQKRVEKNSVMPREKRVYLWVGVLTLRDKPVPVTSTTPTPTPITPALILKRFVLSNKHLRRSHYHIL